MICIVVKQHWLSRKGCDPEVVSAFRRPALFILKTDTTVKDKVRGNRRTVESNLDNLKGILLADKPPERAIALPRKAFCRAIRPLGWLPTTVV